MFLIWHTFSVDTAT